MFGPLFGKELLEMARRRRFFVVRVFIGCGLLFGWWVALAGESPTVAYKNIASLSVVGERLFREWSYWSLWGVVLLTPMLVCGLIAAEKDSRTFETLLTTLLTNREILVGKAASRLALLLILVGSSVPILAVASLYGGFDVMQVAIASGIIGATALFVVVVGMYYSAITFKPYIALLRTYFFLVVLWWFLPALSPASWHVRIESPWGLMNSATIPNEPPIQFVRPTAGWTGTMASRICAQYSVANIGGGPTLFSAWIPYFGLASNILLHLAIAAFLYRRTTRLLRQRLIPGKPPWIFRAATAAYQGLVSGARRSVERSNDPLSQVIWAGEKVTERWHLARLQRIVDRNPLVYRNRVANAFDPERFVAAIQIIIGVVGLFFLLLISALGDAGSLASRTFERTGSWVLVGSTMLFLFCSAILAACAFSRERQYGSWEVLMLADLSPWKHLVAAVRGVAASQRTLLIIVAAFAFIIGYVWGGAIPTILWGLTIAAVWLLVVSHALLASLCHRRIAGALTATLFGLGLILLAPSLVVSALPQFVFPLLILAAITAFLAQLAGGRSARTTWTHLSVALVTMIVLMSMNWLGSAANRFVGAGFDFEMYRLMDDIYRPQARSFVAPLAVVFAPMEWGHNDSYTTSQSERLIRSAPAFLLAALLNLGLFLRWFPRLSRAEPGDSIKSPPPIRGRVPSEARRVGT